MKLPTLPVKLPDLPRPVLLSVMVMAGTAILFAVLFFTLGAARDTAISENQRLTAAAAQVQANLAQSKTDVQYISDNRQAYEELLQSDRLIPHTRAAAARRLQEAAMQHGLTAFNYEFAAAAPTSVTSAASQPTSGDYRLNVESIKISIGAPLDGKIYEFMSDVSNNFLGSAIVQRFQLGRAAVISSDMLRNVGQNRDSGLVKGEVLLMWRTAQANEKKPDGKTK